MNNDYLIFGSPQIEREEIDEVISTLESGWVGTGPKVQKLTEHRKRIMNYSYPPRTLCGDSD